MQASDAQGGGNGKLKMTIEEGRTCLRRQSSGKASLRAASTLQERAPSDFFDATRTVPLSRPDRGCFFEGARAEVM